MSVTKILVIEDDEGLTSLLCRKLGIEGFRVVTARDGVEGLQRMHEHEPQLVLLDLMMPRMGGWETCRRIREVSDVPIIILTALGEDLDTVRGLELGADDYITKPFSFIELAARIRAALRRYRYPLSGKSAIRIDGRLIVDLPHRQVIVGGQEVKLSPIEHKLMGCFIDNVGRVLTHQCLLTQAWGWEYSEETDYLKVYIHHLRKKIEKDPHNPHYILTERGLGYRFQIP